MATPFRLGCATFILLSLLCVAPPAQAQLNLAYAHSVLDTGSADHALKVFTALRDSADAARDATTSLQAWLGMGESALLHPEVMPLGAAFDSVAALQELPTSKLRLLLAATRLHLRAELLTEAKASWTQAEAIRGKCGKLPSLDQGLYHYCGALINYAQNDLAAAQDEYLAAIAIFEKIPSAIRLRAMATRDLSECYHYIHNIDASLASARKAILLHEEAFGAYHHETARAYSRLGHSYVVGTRNAEALENYLRASKIFAKVYGNDHTRTIKSYNGLANVYHNLGDSTRALQYYLKVLHSYWATDGDSSMGAANVYRNLGIHYFDLNHFSVARHYWELANTVTAYRGTKRSTRYLEQLTWIGETYADAGQYQEADHTFNRAFKILLPEADTSGLVPHSKGHLPSTLKWVKGILLAEKGVALGGRGAEESSDEHLQAALACFDQSLSLLDSLRAGFNGQDAQVRVLWFAHQYYEFAIDAAHRLSLATGDAKWLQSAFAYMESSKSTMLNSAIRLADLGAHDPDIAMWQETEAILKGLIDQAEFELGEAMALPVLPPASKLRAYRRAVVSAQEQLQYYQSDLATCAPNYFQTRYLGRPPSFDEVRQRIGPAKGTFIEYFVGRKNYYILAITPTDVHLIQRPVDSLDAAISSYLGQFSNQQALAIDAKEQYLRSAQSLYGFLIAPVAAHLPAKGRIVIAPDGKLGHVPFEALVRNQPELNPDLPYNELPYLLRDHAIGYASSAQSLIQAQPKVTAGEELNLLAFAPNFDDPSNGLEPGRSTLGALKYAPKEVQDISRHIPGKVVVGKEATESQFKALSSGYNILHFATHGTFADENPLWSGLAFSRSPDSTDDGMLHTMELFGMRLNADMAVLSACNTGKGNFVSGEGVMSLARGFMYAGCPSIVMSLYSVDDAATAQIMERFYASLAKGKSKDESLRAAKFEYLRSRPDEYAHPYYWAAHVLIGAPEGFPAPRMALTWVYILGGIAALYLLERIGRK